MKRPFNLRWLLLGAWLSGWTLAPAAEKGMTPPMPANVAAFFDGSAIDATKLLPPPPAVDSLAAQADLAAVLQAQAWRTPEQVAWAKRVADGDFFMLFADVLPPGFTKENCPQIVALFRGVLVSTAPVSEAAKKIYARPRPFVADAGVEPCVERLASGSYPSGHSQGARIWADVLGELFPAYRAELQARATRIAWGRVLGGVHYPTDLAAGDRLGAALVAELKKSPAFQAALEKCRIEIAALLPRKAA